MRRDPLPWVSTPEDRREREQHAGGLVGERIVAVRYFEIDYRRIAAAADDEIVRGSRDVTAAEEWADPSWRWPELDAIDYGIEVDTSRERTFSSIWEQAGVDEGLTLRRERLRSMRLVEDGAFAIWDVTRRSRWTPLLAHTVSAVELYWHRPDPSAQLGCDAITLRFGDDALHLTLGDVDADGRFIGSSDNVAVLDDAAAERLRVGPYGPPSEPV